MHFYYIDESGDTGSNLSDENQPVVVLGGVSVRDEGWNLTQEGLSHILSTFFGGAVPENFELHATDLLSPQGNGPFQGYALHQRCALCLSILDLLAERSHSVHYIGFDKRKVSTATLGLAVEFNPKRPYLLGFDYLVSFINWHVREKLGQSARGMIILDRKEQFHEGVEKIMRERRFGGTQAHRVKMVVEFSYPVDSKKNSMIQLSDLIVYCVRRFIEIEHGYRPNWTVETRNFYASCYARIRDRLPRVTLVERGGRNMDKLNAYLEETRLEPRSQWRKFYQLS